MPGLIWEIGGGRRVPDFRRRLPGVTGGFFRRWTSTMPSDLLRAGQNVRCIDLYRHSRRRAQGGQPLFAPEGMGHEPRTLYQDPQFYNDRSIEPFVRPMAHHPGKARFWASDYRAGDVDIIAPDYNPHCRFLHRGNPDTRARQRKGLPQHALRTSPYAGKDPADGPQMQGDRALRPFCGRLQRAVAPGIGISGFFS